MDSHSNRLFGQVQRLPLYLLKLSNLHIKKSNRYRQDKQQIQKQDDFYLGIVLALNLRDLRLRSRILDIRRIKLIEKANLLACPYTLLTFQLVNKKRHKIIKD